MLIYIHRFSFLISIIAIWTLICSVIFHRFNKIEISRNKEEDVKTKTTEVAKKITDSMQASIQKFCKGFTLQENFTSIVSSERNSFPAFNGFRIIGSFSIIYFHIYYYSLTAADNAQLAFTYNDSLLLAPMFSAILVVDNFFILSGFLLAYSIREQQKKNLDLALDKKFYARKIISRYFRVNPSFLFVSQQSFFNVILISKKSDPRSFSCQLCSLSSSTTHHHSTCTKTSKAIAKGFGGEICSSFRTCIQLESCVCRGVGT